MESFLRLVSDRISKPLSLFSASGQAQKEQEKLLLDEMLDWFQKLATLDDPISVYDRISESLGKVDFFDPPTTHIVANVEDLTDDMEGTVDETEDMDEEIGESADNPPTATTPSGNWMATSTYDIYMVDTPCASGKGRAKKKTMLTTTTPTTMTMTTLAVLHTTTQMNLRVILVLRMKMY